MLRLAAVLLGVVSATILLAELVGLGYLWSAGVLTQQNLYEVRMIMTGSAKAEEDRQAERIEASAASQKEIENARVLRVLNLESRGQELELLKSMTDKSVKELISERQTFDEMKAAFHKELEELQQRSQTAAVEQARSVLLATPVESAVERLMALPLEEAIDLMRGMPEKSIAKILLGFDEPLQANGKPGERAIRGQQIFEALSRGEPARNLIQDTVSKNPEGAAEPPRSGG